MPPLIHAFHLRRITFFNYLRFTPLLMLRIYAFWLRCRRAGIVDVDYLLLIYLRCAAAICAVTPFTPFIFIIIDARRHTLTPIDSHWLSLPFLIYFTPIDWPIIDWFTVLLIIVWVFVWCRRWTARHHTHDIDLNIYPFPDGWGWRRGRSGKATETFCRCRRVLSDRAPLPMTMSTMPSWIYFIWIFIERWPSPLSPSSSSRRHRDIVRGDHDTSRHDWDISFNYNEWNGMKFSFHPKNQTVPPLSTELNWNWMNKYKNEGFWGGRWFEIRFEGYVLLLNE